MYGQAGTANIALPEPSGMLKNDNPHLTKSPNRKMIPGAPAIYITKKNIKK